MRRFEIKVFKATDNVNGYKKIRALHLEVLHRYGIIKVPALTTNIPNRYILYLEDIATGEIQGGIEIELYNKDTFLPCFRAFGDNNKWLLEYSDTESCELCSLWNSNKLAGQGFPTLLMKAAVAFCLSINIKRLLGLCDDFTLQMFQNVGFSPNTSVGLNGLLFNSKEDIIFHFVHLELSTYSESSALYAEDIINLAAGKNTTTVFKTSKGIETELTYNLECSKIIFTTSNLSVIDKTLYSALLEHPELIKTLNWRTFEKVLADILETFGYEIELMQGTKDGGIDVIAFGNNTDFGRHKYLLQAKRWKNKVDLDVVKNVLFNHEYYKATKSCLATTATFTKGAWELAETYKWQLELKDYESIQLWINKAYKNKYGNE